MDSQPPNLTRDDGAAVPAAPVAAAAPSDAAAPDFRVLFEAAPGINLVLATDAPRFTMVAASDERLDATHTTRETTLGRPLFEVFSDANPANPAPHGVAKLRASLETVLRTRAPHRMAVTRYDLRRPDGTWEERYWAPENRPVLGPDGALRYLLHHVKDVTELVLQRAATAAAERREAELRAVLESMRDGVYIGGPDGITLANRAALDQLGFASREELNRGIATLADEIQTRDAETGEFIPPERQAFARAFAGEAVVQDVLVRHRVTGEDRVVRCAAAPVVVDRAVIGAVAVNTDVTELRRAAAERERLLAESERARAEAEAARAEAERANRAKGDFLAVMSHELRTPLQAISGYADILEMGIYGAITPEQHAALERIQASQLHLLGLIDDVLGFSRVEAGAVTYRLSDVPVADAVAAAEVLVTPQLRAKGLGYTWAGCAPELRVRADRDRLQQILLNLLSNAVKFTSARTGQQGRVEVSGCTDATGAWVQIHVRDTGLGIPPDKLDAIFEPFMQVESGLTRVAGGTGLGLAISRDLARGMGGDLTVESAEGTGSTFTLTLPHA